MALLSEHHPDVVVPVAEARLLLAAARAQDVSAGGCFSPGPSGVQVWSGPWDGAGGRPGSSELVGSVDWSEDVPLPGSATVYRVHLTAVGSRAGLTTHDVLDLVLGLADGFDDSAPARVLPLPRRPLA